MLDAETMRRLLPLLIGVGFAVGALSGFFGIGGGFLIVPGLMGATAMPLINAIGSSLVSVTAFGLTTAASYAWSGLIDWPLAFLFILGGTLGGLARHPPRPPPRRLQARAHAYVFRHRHCGWALRCRPLDTRLSR